MFCDACLAVWKDCNRNDLFCVGCDVKLLTRIIGVQKVFPEMAVGDLVRRGEKRTRCCGVENV